MASFTVMGFVDTWMVASVGTAEVAAAMPGGIIAFTITALPLGITRCVSTFAAQALGRGEPHEGARFAWQGIYFGCIAGVACAVLWPVAPTFFSLFGHEPEVVVLEVDYFRVRLWGIGLSIIIGALNSFFYGVHRPTVALIGVLTANLTNIVLNYVFIFGNWGAPRLGLTGAALAMVLGFVAEIVVLLGVFLSSSYRTEFSTRLTWRPDWTRTRQLLHIGWPAGMQVAIDVLGWGLLIIMLVGRFGKEHLAASNIAIQYMMLSFMPAMGLAQALSALVGRYIGEGQLETAVQRVYETLCICLVYVGLMGVFFFFFRFSLIGVFSTEPVVIQLGANVLLCAVAFQLFDGLGITFFGALRGAGDTHWPAGFTVVVLIVVFTPLSLGSVAYTNLESLGPWLAGTVNVILLGLGFWWRFAQGSWREINIFASRETGQTEQENRLAEKTKGTVHEPSLLSSTE
jgi:MATE family multidrug resistance protein